MCKYNGEGYYDPTAYEAIMNIEKRLKKWRPIVYICSPYSGKQDVAKQAEIPAQTTNEHSVSDIIEHLENIKKYI